MSLEFLGLKINMKTCLLVPFCSLLLSVVCQGIFRTLNWLCVFLRIRNEADETEKLCFGMLTTSEIFKKAKFMHLKEFVRPWVWLRTCFACTSDHECVLACA